MMDSKSQSPPPPPPHDNDSSSFRKQAAAHRNYRRRSPTHGSSSSPPPPPHGGSPRRGDHTSREDHHSRNKYDGREQVRKYARTTDSFRHSDKHSSRTSSYRHDKYAADEDRKQERLSSSNSSRSKDYGRSSMDKYSRERSDYRSKECDRSGSAKKYDEVEKERRTRDGDEKKDSQRSSGEPKSDRAVYYSESRRQKDDIQISKNKDRNSRKVGEVFGNEDKESSGKKHKFFGSDKEGNSGKDDERKTSGSKLSHESKPDLGAVKTSGFDSGNDLDAAKVAAMRAAELVNKNLVGANCLTTDQKKKLLWGSKKSTPTVESGHRWDMATFDPERQEKFNKLMGVKGEAKVEQNTDNQNDNDLLRAEKQKELQLDLEKQYTAGLRRRDGRTVGLGL